MEPSGRNRWQPVANATAPRPAQTRKPLPWVATSCGKEGVDGSSPSEGFGFPPAQLQVPLSRLASLAAFDVHAASTSVHRGRYSALNSSSRRAACSRPSRAR
jgi:hypothetical protein